MPTIERTIATNAAPARVWRYLSDFTSTNEWDPGTVRTVLLAGDGGPGTTYENVSRFLGRETTLIYTVLEASEPTRLQLRGENATVTATDTMTITAVGTGSRLHYRADIVGKGMLGRADPLLSLPVLNYPFKRLGDGAERGLEDALARL
jgi:uncharacterized protein YndB with AHSA1/START domain